MTHPIRISAALALALVATAGCSEGGSRTGATADTLGDVSSGDPCAKGRLIAYEGEEFCVISGAIIETGFQCPPELPFAHEGEGFNVCAPQDNLDDADVGVIGAIGGSGCFGPRLDVLVVVDNSASMCSEQVALNEDLAGFAARLQALDADVRLAATSPALGCVEPTAAASGGGRFNTMPATAFPPPCQLKVDAMCDSDADCAAALGDTEDLWACRRANTASCATNPNGSLNTSCRRRCATDADCVAFTGRADALCQQPSASPADAGCIVPPPPANCPAEVSGGLRSWLHDDELDAAACVLSLGVNQDKCFKYEQGIGAAWAALDPDGPNAAQAEGFVRPDAHLVLVFLSDEDDCTVAGGESLSEDEFQLCGTLNDADSGGPLTPISQLAARFRSLKQPGYEVVVAVSSGDTLATTPDEILQERLDYTASKSDPKTCFQQTTMCTGDYGSADYGARYFALAQAFGANGVGANLCAPRSIEALFDGVVQRITALEPASCGP